VAGEMSFDELKKMAMSNLVKSVGPRHRARLVTTDSELIVEPVSVKPDGVRCGVAGEGYEVLITAETLAVGARMYRV
jgi:hypothetical protein